MSWLGIAVFVVFSLGLGWFMRRQPGKPRPLPPDVGQWQRAQALPDEPEPSYVEQRLWLHEGGLIRPHRLIEQRRVRAERDGRILRTLPERLVDQWRGPLQ